jgi:hypothetical protein
VAFGSFVFFHEYATRFKLLEACQFQGKSCLGIDDDSVAPGIEYLACSLSVSIFPASMLDLLIHWLMASSLPILIYQNASFLSRTKAVNGRTHNHVHRDDQILWEVQLPNPQSKGLEVPYRTYLETAQQRSMPKLEGKMVLVLNKRCNHVPGSRKRERNGRLRTVTLW